MPWTDEEIQNEIVDSVSTVMTSLYAAIGLLERHTDPEYREKMKARLLNLLDMMEAE